MTGECIFSKGCGGAVEEVPGGMSPEVGGVCKNFLGDNDCLDEEPPPVEEDGA